MFIQLHVLNRKGANVPPTVVQEVLRIDLIQRMRAIEVSDFDEPCTELILDNEETIVCQGELADHLRALDEVLG
jgi:hypothetical protein